ITSFSVTTITRILESPTLTRCITSTVRVERSEIPIHRDWLPGATQFQTVPRFEVSETTLARGLRLLLISFPTIVP
ncbi:hypothetical protein HYR99_40620, partial [Candidatus Poribacteria bacterium]|nr:hypothetical protein [Candidatus Poribacteria bacterium]